MHVGEHEAADRFQDCVLWQGFRYGHMMGLRLPDLVLANDDTRECIQVTNPDPVDPSRSKP